MDSHINHSAINDAATANSLPTDAIHAAVTASDTAADEELQHLVTEMFGADALHLLADELPEEQQTPAAEEVVQVAKSLMELVTTVDANMAVLGSEPPRAEISPGSSWAAKSDGAEFEVSPRPSHSSLVAATHRGRRTPLSDRFIVSALGDLRIAFEMAAVVEIISVSEVTPLPALPNWLLGIVPLRGEIVSVVDLSRLWGVGRVALQGGLRLVVIRSRQSDMVLSIAVDRVLGQRTLPPHARQSRPAGLRFAYPTHWQGLAESDSGPVVVLDAEAICRTPELLAFQEN